MVYKVVWTDPAIADLKGLCDYIANDNPDAAQKLALEVVEHAEGLGTFPLRGKVYPKFGMEPETSRDLLSEIIASC